MRWCFFTHPESYSLYIFFIKVDLFIPFAFYPPTPL